MLSVFVVVAPRQGAPSTSSDPADAESVVTPPGSIPTATDLAPASYTQLAAAASAAFATDTATAAPTAASAATTFLDPTFMNTLAPPSTLAEVNSAGR